VLKKKLQNKPRKKVFKFKYPNKAAKSSKLHIQELEAHMRDEQT
jgi:hypothetical protein